MAKLSYRTRGGSSPDGKQKIWFSCHPEDRERVFVRLTEDVLKLQNCAIWYDAEPEADNEADDLLQMLGQMQLFVIPVTHRLLSTSNRTLDVELAFALDSKNQIPVLPVLMESGLDRLFEEKFGSMQYLDITVRDVTQKSYMEKLDAFLTQVLAGDALADQVRSSFDVYLFLSYRKKDRAFAQDLMRRIHETELFRGVGIWYDEYLIPGEDYNEAIAAALSKSPIFALAVTPNLVNEENYVAQKEYPQARAEGKFILPFELVSTDQESMRQVFSGIRDNISVQDAGAVREELTNALKALSVTPDEKSAQRQYYLGQAYLSGIDVEVNSEFALHFLTAAAEGDEPRAMEALGDMYASGNRIPRDLKQAEYWKKRRAEFLRERYEKQPEEYLEEYSLALVTLSSFYSQIGDINAEREAALRLLGITEGETSKKEGGLLQRRLQAEAVMMTLAIAEKKYEEALSYSRGYLETAQCMSALCSLSDTLQSDTGAAPEHTAEKQEINRLVARGHYWSGMIQMLRLQNDAAMDSFSQAADLLQQFPDDNSPEYKEELSNCMLKKAYLHRREKNEEREEACLLRAWQLLQALTDEFPYAKYVEDFAQCGIDLAKLYQRRGNESEAGRICEEAIGRILPLISQLYDISSRFYLGGILTEAAVLMEKGKKTAVAREYYMVSMNLMLSASEEMAQTPETAEKMTASLVACHDFLDTDADRHLLAWKSQPGKYINARRGLGLGYERLAEQFAARPEKNSGLSAAMNYDRARGIFSDLASETVNRYDRYHAEKNCLEWLNCISGEPESMRELYEYGIDECEDLVQREGGRPEYLALLCGFYDGAGRCCREINSLEESVQYFLKALPMHREMPREYQTRRERQNYAEILEFFAFINHRAGNSYAEQQFQEELSLLGVKPQKQPAADIDPRGKILRLYQSMDACLKRTEWERGREIAEDILNCYDPKLLQNDADLRLHRAFFEACRSVLLGMPYDGGKQSELRKSYYEIELPLILTLYQKSGSEEDAKALCDTQIQIAERESDSERKANLYHLALELAERHLAVAASVRLSDLAAQAHVGIARELLVADRKEQEQRRFRLGKSRIRKEAEAHLGKAAAEWDALAKQFPAVERYQKSAREALALGKNASLARI